MYVPVKVWSSEDFANIWYEHLTFWSVRQNSVKDFCQVDSEQFITTFHTSLKNVSVNSFFFLTIPWLITAKGKVRFYIQEKKWQWWQLWASRKLSCTVSISHWLKCIGFLAVKNIEFFDETFSWFFMICLLSLVMAWINLANQINHENIQWFDITKNVAIIEFFKEKSIPWLFLHEGCRVRAD